MAIDFLEKFGETGSFQPGTNNWTPGKQTQVAELWQKGIWGKIGVISFLSLWAGIPTYVWRWDIYLFFLKHF